MLLSVLAVRTSRQQYEMRNEIQTHHFKIEDRYTLKRTIGMNSAMQLRDSAGPNSLSVGYLVI